MLKRKRYMLFLAAAAALLVLAFLPGAAKAAQGETFTSDDVNGVAITYKVLTEDASTNTGTVQVGNGSSAAVDLSTTKVTVPEKVSYNGVEYDVVTIGRMGFSSRNALESVEMPDGVTSIGENAFHNCEKLIRADIPSGVTSIGKYAFAGCWLLESVVIPEGVTEIPEAAFTACWALTELIIPDSVVSIGDSAFAQVGLKSAKTSITIGSKVKSIGEYAFMECRSLTEIIIPDSVTTLGTSAFYGCVSLESAVLSSGLTSIPDSMRFMAARL